MGQKNGQRSICRPLVSSLMGADKERMIQSKARSFSLRQWVFWLSGALYSVQLLSKYLSTNQESMSYKFHDAVMVLRSVL